MIRGPLLSQLPLWFGPLVLIIEMRVIILFFVLFCIINFKLCTYGLSNLIE